MSSRDPSLSVVIPVSMMAGYLNKLNATLKGCYINNIQVYLIHDVQDDSTGPEIKKLSIMNRLVESNLVFFYEGLFGNPGSARNYPLEKVKTPWITFWDADDAPDIREILKLIEKMKVVNADIGIGRFQSVNFHNPYVTIEGEKHYPPLNLDSVTLNIGLWRWVFKTEILQGIKFPELKVGEDQIFLCRVLNKKREIYFYDRIVYYYSINRNGQITNSNVTLTSINNAIEVLYKMFTENNSTNVFQSRVYIKLLMSYLKRCKSFVDYFYFFRILYSSYWFKIINIKQIVLLAKDHFTYRNSNQ